MFFFFEQEDLPDFSKIKDVIKSLVPYELTAERNLSDMDRQLSNRLQMLSVLMFTKRKAENKNFTINSTKGYKGFLRNVSVDEDSENLSEDDSLKVSDIFHNNIEAFHELVAQCYISKTARDYKTDNEIFCVQCKSKYCKDDTDIFILNKHGNFFALSDNNKSIDLKMFITDYFGPIEKNISNEFNEVAINKQLSHKEMQIEFSRIFNNLSDSIGKSHEFINGAITFFDFLGWKGLWQNSETKPLETVAELIDSFKENIKEMTFSFFPNIPVKMNISTLISISDTIAIFTPQVSDISKSKLLSLHADIARFILESSCKCRYPIRGAITYGKYSIMNNVTAPPKEDRLLVEFRGLEQKSQMPLSKRTKEMIEKANIYRLNLSELNEKNDVASFKKLVQKDDVSTATLATWIRGKIDLPLRKQIEDFKHAEALLEYVRNQLYSIGIYIFKDSFREDAVSGLCLYDELYPVVLLNNKTTFTRQLFTVFHELYHIFLQETDIDFTHYQKEKECNTFASLFLIPKNDFLSIIKDQRNYENDNYISNLADRYCVSRDAIRYRLLKLDKISLEYYQQSHDDDIRRMNSKTAGGNFYYTKMSYLGQPYLKNVFSQYYAGQIPISKVSLYTQMKSANVSKLASTMFGGEF